MPRCSLPGGRVAAVAAVAAMVSAGVAAAGGASTKASDGTAPASKSPPRITGNAQDGQIVSADPGSWRHSPRSFAYQWRLCNSSGDACTDILRATTRLYPVRHSDPGHTVRVVVTATNKAGSGAASSAPTSLIGIAPAGAPVAGSRPAVTGRTEQGATLTAGAGTWTGTAPIQLRYDWRRCNPLGGACQELDRHGQTYTLRPGDVGQSLRVLVLAQNGVGTSAALSDPTGTVHVATPPAAPTAAPPKNTSKPTISGTARRGQTLTASSGSWTGKLPITFEYRWQRCDKHGDGCDGVGDKKQTYGLAERDVGHTIRVRVRARNSDGKEDARSDPTVVVVASQAPVNRKRPQVQGTARQGETLTASQGDWNGAGQISYSYQWLRCNTTGSGCSTIGVTARSYVLASSDVSHTMRVAVTASNSAGSAQALSDPTAVVAPRGNAPANTRRPAVSGKPIVGQTVNVNSGSWNGDQPIQFGYVWQRCDTSGAGCRAISGATGSTYRLTVADVGHTLRAAVTASNGFGSASALSDPTGLVKGLPTVASLPAISGSSRVGATLKAKLGTWTSPLPLTFFFQWARCNAKGDNCVPIRAATRQSYVVTAADAGHTLIVQIKAVNSVGSSYANSRATGVVGGAAPPPPPPPPRPGGCASISSVSLPERLVIDRIEYSPDQIHNRNQPLTARFHVTTTRGRCISGALVYAVGVPFDRLSRAPETPTASNGWATITFRVLPTFALRPGNLVVIFVRARKPGGSVLAGVSTRRLVSVRVGR